MTRDIDDLIKQALQEDEKDLLARIGDEPGYFKQAFQLLNGPLAWLMWIMSVLNLASFLGFLFCAWQLLATGNPTDAVKWGVGALLLANLTLFFKGGMGVHAQVNRVLREFKRMELRLARIEGRQ